MKVVLVNPPKTRYDLNELAPPLGLLRLAAIAERHSAVCIIVDFNRLWHTDSQLRDGPFLDRAEQILLNSDGDIYGFTSMAVDSHVAIELALRLKRALPSAVVVLGGTHFSSIAEDIRALYPFVDVVVAGEGEESFASLLQRYGQGGAPVDQLGIFRSPRDASADLPSITPAYHLVDLDSYFHLNPRRLVNIESGRGCVFKCKFCYSPSHYSGVSYREIDAVIEDLHNVARCGAKQVFFVEDNFLNDRRHAVRLCTEIAAAGLDLRWSCYTTFPQLDEGTIRVMALAGCDGIFAGIDAVGRASNLVFAKSHMPRETVFDARLRSLIDHGITPTCAFLVSPPSHACGGDLCATVEAAIRAKALGAQVRMNTLTLYNQTPSRAASGYVWEYDEFKVGILLDVPPELEANPFARAHPELYPFHSRYVSKREQREFVSLAHCLFTLIYCFPKLLASRPSPGEFCVSLARRVLGEIGPLDQIPKPDRRQVEYATASRLLYASRSVEPAVEEVAVLQ